MSIPEGFDLLGDPATNINLLNKQFEDLNKQWKGEDMDNQELRDALGLEERPDYEADLVRLEREDLAYHTMKELYKLPEMRKAMEYFVLKEGEKK